MSITLSKAGAALELPKDLQWVDEFAWSALSQSTERSITGAYIIDMQTRTAGRPITLEGKENTAWLQRSAAKTLKAWVDAPGQVYTLTHNGTAYQVMFDHGTDEISRAFKVAPVVEYDTPVDGDHYCSLTLRFFTV